MARGGHHRAKKTHSLFLKGGERTYYRNRVTVDFSPHNSPFIPPHLVGIAPVPMPRFNGDSRTFTPGFVLGGVEVDEEHYREKHEKKIRQHDEIDSQ